MAWNQPGNNGQDRDPWGSSKYPQQLHQQLRGQATAAIGTLKPLG